MESTLSYYDIFCTGESKGNIPRKNRVESPHLLGDLVDESRGLQVNSELGFGKVENSYIESNKITSLCC